MQGKAFLGTESTEKELMFMATVTEWMRFGILPDPLGIKYLYSKLHATSQL